MSDNLNNVRLDIHNMSAPELTVLSAAIAARLEAIDAESIIGKCYKAEICTEIIYVRVKEKLNRGIYKHPDDPDTLMVAMWTFDTEDDSVIVEFREWSVSDRYSEIPAEEFNEAREKVVGHVIKLLA